MRVALVSSAGQCGIAWTTQYGLTQEKADVRIRRQRNGCWRWTGVITGYGYPQWLHAGKTYRAHRLVYAAMLGPIPAGKQLDHLCCNKWCVNPAHLEPVTGRVNTLRATRGTAQINHRKTACARRGHPFTPENTRLKQGRYGTLRSCRACERELNRKLQAKYRQQKRNVPCALPS